MTSHLWICLLFPGLPFLVLFFLGRTVLKEREAADRPFTSMRRPAGYSLQQRADDQWDDVLFWLLLTVFTAFIPSILFIVGEGKGLWGYLIVGTISSSSFLHRLWKSFRPLPNYWLGLRGEQAVGGILDTLHGDHIAVFHDLEIKENGHSRNIDHLILTRCGVILVETKARRKKRDVTGEKWKLKYDGKRIQFPDGCYDTDSLEQTIWNREWLLRKTRAWTGGESIPILAVVTFPGWWVERTGKGEIRVNNPREIASLLDFESRPLEEKTWKILQHQLETACMIELESFKPKAGYHQAKKKAPAIAIANLPRSETVPVKS